MSGALDKADVLRLARLESQIERAVRAASEPIGVALRAIRDDKLYRATHASFERYVVERWGFSKATAYRMMDAEKLVGISPPETASSQVSASHGETIRTQPSTNGLPPEKESEDGPAATPPAVTDGPPERPARPAVARRPSAPPTGPSGDGTQAPKGGSGSGTPADVLTTAPSGPSPVGGNALGEVMAPPAAVPDPEEPCCDYRDHSPGPCACPNHDEQTSLHPFGGMPVSPPQRPPTDRALASRVFVAMRDIDPTDAGPVTTPEEATFAAQWMHRMYDAWQAKYAPDTSPRPAGRVIKPGDRKAKADAIGGKADPATCKHPKQSRQVLGYMVKCGLCDTKVA